MRWLIVEDALRNRVGHWYEYVRTFVRGLRELGDSVIVLADESAESFIINDLAAEPVLPESIWHRISDNASLPRRYLRVPLHALKTQTRMKHWLRANTAPDVIFVPTVLVHHLLGWAMLLKGPLRETRVRTILFFPNAPIYLDLDAGVARWESSPSAILLRRLVRWLAPEVRKGSVIFAAETKVMVAALSQGTGVPFQYLPHPVDVSVKQEGLVNGQRAAKLIMASFGGARLEKGYDVLIGAIEQCERHKEATKTEFLVQTVGDVEGRSIQLQSCKHVTIVNRYFVDQEYSDYLARANVLVLPYRVASYGLRISRIAVEAMVNGLPIVTTRGTTLASQAAEYGSAILCDDGSTESLVEAIHRCEEQYEALRIQALRRSQVAKEHFSVAGFRSTLLKG